MIGRGKRVPPGWRQALLSAALALLVLSPSFVPGLQPIGSALATDEAEAEHQDLAVQNQDRPTRLRARSRLAPLGDPRFGANGILAGDDISASLMRAVGAGFERLEARWDVIGAEPGRLDFAAFDEQVERAEWLGFQLDVVLIGIPTWARLYPDEPGGRLMANLGEPVFRLDGTPNPDNYWSWFVYQMADRYAGRVAVWEIWNEPNLTMFWSATPADYHRVLQTAAEAIRAADPSARVLFGGLHYFASADRLPFLEQVLALERPDRPSFDLLGLHVYHRVGDVVRGIQLARVTLARFGFRQPIWLNETNVPVKFDPLSPTETPRGVATLDEQAAFLVQAHAIALAAGAEQISWYRASEVGEHLTWGLLREDDSARPAFAAYRTVVRYLGGATRAVHVPGPDYDAVVVERPTGRVTVAWARGDRPAVAVLGPVAPGARLVDKYGVEHALRIVDGRAHVDLAPATLRDPDAPGQFMAGGDPRLLVEPPAAG